MTVYKKVLALAKASLPPGCELEVKNLTAYVLRSPWGVDFLVNPNGFMLASRCCTVPLLSRDDAMACAACATPTAIPAYSRNRLVMNLGSWGGLTEWVEDILVLAGSDVLEAAMNGAALASLENLMACGLEERRRRL